MDTSVVREFLLAQTFCHAKAANVSAEALKDVHLTESGWLSTINLQTMSDIGA